MSEKNQNGSLCMNMIWKLYPNTVNYVSKIIVLNLCDVNYVVSRLYK